MKPLSEIIVISGKPLQFAALLRNLQFRVDAPFRHFHFFWSQTIFLKCVICGDQLIELLNV